MTSPGRHRYRLSVLKAAAVFEKEELAHGIDKWTGDALAWVAVVGV